MKGAPVDLSRHRGATLAVAAAVMIVVVLAVLLFGIIPYPDLPTLAEQPNPPVSARLALIDYTEEAPCLSVVEGDGTTREVACGREFKGFDLRWTGPDEVGRRPGGIDQQQVVDVDSGVVRTMAEESDDPDSSLQSQYGRLSSFNDDGTVGIEVEQDDGPPRLLLELTGPRSYSLFRPTWSHDGAWVVVEDSQRQILVVPAEGGQARIWADNTSLSVDPALSERWAGHTAAIRRIAGGRIPGGSCRG